MKLGIYYTLGDLGLLNSINIFQSLLDAKIDLLEIGLPFSDPLLDGDVVQQSHMRAMQHNISWQELCAAIDKLKLSCNATQKISVMTTTQLLYTEKNRNEFPTVDGLLFSDLNYNIKYPHPMPTPRVWFLSPDLVLNTKNLIPPENISMIYLTRIQGITGDNQKIQKVTEQAIKILKNNFNHNIWLGFGISNKQDIQEAKEIGADGVVIGSAFIKYIQNSFQQNNFSKNKLNAIICEFIKEIWQ